MTNLAQAESLSGESVLIQGIDVKDAKTTEDFLKVVKKKVAPILDKIYLDTFSDSGSLFDEDSQATLKWNLEIEDDGSYATDLYLDNGSDSEMGEDENDEIISLEEEIKSDENANVALMLFLKDVVDPDLEEGTSRAGNMEGKKGLADKTREGFEGLSAGIRLVISHKALKVLKRNGVSEKPQEEESEMAVS